MLNEYVERVMKHKGLSLADVQRNCDHKITAGYIGKIIKGTVTNLSFEKILALAKGLEVDPYEVFAACYGRPPREQTTPDAFALVDLMQKLLLNSDVLEALPLILKLKPEQRKVLLRPLKFASKKKSKKKGKS
jgi:hypothetical protein